MGHEEHRHDAPRSLRIFIVTASDTRSEREDDSGSFLRAAAAEAGHTLAGYRIVKDEPIALRAALDDAARAGADAIVVNGGTGIAARDQTYEVVAALLDKRIDGFGELFRMLSFGEVGSAAMLSRAIAGVWGGRAVFSIPGARAAVRLAWEKLIAPEVGHVVREIRKDAGPRP